MKLPRVREFSDNPLNGYGHQHMNRAKQNLQLKERRMKLAKNAKTTKLGLDEGDLTKGQIRKLNALRKSIGDDLGTKAFAEWLAVQESAPAPTTDPVADTIAETLEKLLTQKKMRLPRKGYLIKRGRGRVIVSPADSQS